MPLKSTAVGRSNMVKLLKRVLLKVLTWFRNIKHTWLRKYLHLCGLSKKQNKQTNKQKQTVCGKYGFPEAWLEVCVRWQPGLVWRQIEDNGRVYSFHVGPRLGSRSTFISHLNGGIQPKVKNSWQPEEELGIGERFTRGRRSILWIPEVRVMKKAFSMF